MIQIYLQTIKLSLKIIMFKLWCGLVTITIELVKYMLNAVIM